MVIPNYNISFVSQEKCNIGYEGILVNTFSIKSIPENDLDLIDALIHDHYFIFNIEPPAIKNALISNQCVFNDVPSLMKSIRSTGFLRPAFNIGEFTKNHFRSFSQKALFEYLLEFIDQPPRDWDKPFISLTNYIIPFINQENVKNFYLADIEWYRKKFDPEEQDDILFTFEEPIYGYYYWLIWIDRVQSEIVCCVMWAD